MRFGRVISREAIVWLRLETAVGHYPLDGLALLRSGDSRVRCARYIEDSSTVTLAVFTTSGGSPLALILSLVY